MNIDAQTQIEIKDLCTDYPISGQLIFQKKQWIRVLNNLNLNIRKGETLGIVGESGCGKTTLANSLIRLLIPTSGQVLFEGKDILDLDEGSLRQLRCDIQIVFQNPSSSLNPRRKVLDLVAEPLRTHTDLKNNELKRRVGKLLDEVGLDLDHVESYPHELSGGQAQRVALARALALNPKFLILDEPTSAVDVSVQAKVINLLEQLQQMHGLTYLFISHDLSVIQHVSSRVAVMYLGEIVELAPSEDIFRSACHPYTKALLSSTPTLEPDSGRYRIILSGSIPNIANPPPGCRFHTRCPEVLEICHSKPASTYFINNEHWATCHLLV